MHGNVIVIGSEAMNRGIPFLLPITRFLFKPQRYQLHFNTALSTIPKGLAELDYLHS